MISPEGIDIPEVEVDTENGTLVLTWLNTVVRTYRDSSVNHVEYTQENGKVVGYMAPQTVMDALFEREFPSTFSPILDPATIDWYVGVEASSLGAELKDL